MSSNKVNKGAIYAVVGIIVAAGAVAVFFMLNQDQNQILSPQVTPQVPEQTSEPSTKWVEEHVTFTDSNGHIPEVIVSQQWTNGDALQACSIIVENPTETKMEKPDVSWCTEFVNSFG